MHRPVLEVDEEDVVTLVDNEEVEVEVEVVGHESHRAGQRY